MSEKKLLFELHGLKIMSDSIYLISNKRDFSAPTGFQERGTTKLPSDGVANTFHCPYKPISKTHGSWDTGFYELSPCYTGMNRDKVKIKVKGLVENIVKPYREAIGDNKALHEHNNEFFDTTKWTIQDDLVLRTSNPLDVVTLYFALMGREVVPKHLKGDSTFADAAYVVVDVNESVKKRDEDASNMFQAIGVFEELYKSDRARLDKILFYIGRNMSDDTKIESYRGMFKSYLEASPANVESFNNLVKASEKEQGLDELNIYYSLKSRDIRHPKVSKASSGSLYYEDREIGVDFKSAAKRISKDPEMSDIKREILLGGDIEEEE